MTEIKVASFNVEWMTKLFVGTKAKFYQGPSKKGGPGGKQGGQVLNREF